MQKARTLFLSTNALHHAYLLTGDLMQNRTALEPIIQDALGADIVGHPDFREFTEEQIGIDEARLLKDEQSRMPLKATRRIFVLQTYGITEPAQHALLKTLEDPNPTSLFFLLMPSKKGLLATLRSRLMIISPERSESNDDAEAQEFLKAYPTQRLKVIEKIAEGAGDPDKKKEAKRRIEAFTESLEKALHGRFQTRERGYAETALREVLTVKKYLTDSSPALRLLVEHLALVIPVFE